MPTESEMFPTGQTWRVPRELPLGRVLTSTLAYRAILRADDAFVVSAEVRSPHARWTGAMPTLARRCRERLIPCITEPTVVRFRTRGSVTALAAALEPAVDLGAPRSLALACWLECVRLRTRGSAHSERAAAIAALRDANRVEPPMSLYELGCALDTAETMR